jgi:cysteine desulfurase/selenocysteine lyase
MVHTVGSGDDPDVWDILPYKFESGTPALAEVIGLGATIDYLQQLNYEAVIQHEKSLTKRLVNGIRPISGIFICGGISHENERISLVSFAISGISSYDIGLLLSTHNIAVRTGNLCAQPLLGRMGLDDVLRVSLSFYNTEEEIDIFIKTLFEIIDQLQGIRHE